MLLGRTPLAWLQLTHQKARLLAAIAGITFAAVLMFMQFGFQDALYDSATLIHQRMYGDLFIVSVRSESLVGVRPFSRRYLYQTMNNKQVETVTPLYVGLASWKNPWRGNERSLLVLGFETRAPLLELPGVAENLGFLRQSDTILFDRLSRTEFGEVAERFEHGERVTAQVNNRRVEVKGLVTLGASFAADGNLITSDLNFLRLFPERNPAAVDVGILKLRPDANMKQVKDELASLLPADLRVFTKEEFVAFEKNYWETSSSIGFIFNIGVMMGFVVGIVISYQILYTDVVNHLAEYATLKAMGYTDGYLIGVVFQESLILSGLGYLPAILLTWWLFNITGNATNLPMQLTLSRSLTVFVLTVVMCFLSGVIAMRKLRQADPAEIF